MTTTRIAAAAAALLLLAAGPARAYSTEEAARSEVEQGKGRTRADFLLRMALDVGGDTITKVRWSDGDTSTIKAGQLATFSVGVLVQPPGPWSVEATIGYKFDKVNGSNGTIEFTRVPLDVVVSVGNGTHRIGAGPTFHLSPTFNCDAAGLCAFRDSYDTAVGAMLQYAFKAGRTGGVEAGARITVISYRGAGLPSYDGTSAGLFLGAWF